MTNVFLLRNIPNKYRDQVRDEIRINELEKELEFYKSIFQRHTNSAIFNLRIKKINGNKIWVDKVKIYTDYKLLHSLDEDDEVK